MYKHILSNAILLILPHMAIGMLVDTVSGEACRLFIVKPLPEPMQAYWQLDPQCDKSYSN